MMVIFLLIFKVYTLQVYSWPDFFVYNKQSQNNNCNSFSTSKPSIFIIHGFSSSSNQENLKQLKNETFKYHDVNIVMVDWSEGAAFPNYFNALVNSKKLGQMVSDFIKANKLNDVHCIGHSLGAHACGFAGKLVKIKRISGLDPAGPGFKDSSPSDRLDMSDADFVDVIHTDNYFGIEKAIGHQNFYPDGGSTQSSCLGVQEFYCSHTRAVDYFVESVNLNCKFKSYLSESYDNYKTGKYSDEFSYMGFYAVQRAEITGQFFLKTKSTRPFCFE